MEEISPTRTNLLLRKAQIQLALQGVELLKNKRDVLVSEFIKLMDEMFGRRQELEDITHQAYHALAICRAFDGEECLKSASLAAKRAVNIDIRQKNIWGVPIHDVERIHLDRLVTERGYSFAGMPARVDIVARRFEEILTSIVAIASTEILLRRLGEEIKRTTRRVNALEQVLLPRLRGESRYIGVILEEREREDICRLKKIKGSVRATKRGRQSHRPGKGSRARVQPDSSWRRIARASSRISS